MQITGETRLCDRTTEGKHERSEWATSGKPASAAAKVIIIYLFFLLQVMETNKNVLKNNK